MSDLILHAVLHTRKLYSSDFEDNMTISRDQFVKMAQESVTKLQSYLNDGYVIKDAFNGSHDEYEIRHYLLFREDTSPKFSKVETVTLYNVEVKTTFSKSQNVSFDYLSCKFGNGKTVNIFDHPDEARNTWKIAENKGWDWQGLQSVLMDGYPVPATVTYDGQFYSLVDIISLQEHNLMGQEIDYKVGFDNAKQDDNEDENEQE